MLIENETTAAETTETVAKPAFTLDEIQRLISDQVDFEKGFKKRVAGALLAPGQWVFHSANHSHRLTLSDGSYIRLKFFDTVKKIFNSKNVEVPGRESYLSYIDVAVMPKGYKGYEFKLSTAQHVWGGTPSKAKVLHDASVLWLTQFAWNLKIDLSTPEAWESYYAGN